MKIACLAWGSLIWKSAPLELASIWQGDGPRLPIELVRVGDEGELATTLWAVLQQSNLASARELLRQRGQIDVDRPEWIGSFPSQFVYPCKESIAEWLRAKRLDAVI